MKHTLEVKNRYTGPDLKQVAIAAIIISPVVFAIALSSEHKEQRGLQLQKEKEAARQAVAAQPLDSKSKSPLLRGRDLTQTVDARVAAIDLELRNLQATGRPEDLDRRLALLAERKSLTGE
jgi:hypothetical protein